MPQASPKCAKYLYHIRCHKKKPATLPVEETKQARRTTCIMRPGTLRAYKGCYIRCSFGDTRRRTAGCRRTMRKICTAAAKPVPSERRKRRKDFIIRWRKRMAVYSWRINDRLNEKENDFPIRIVIILHPFLICMRYAFTRAHPPY